MAKEKLHTHLYSAGAELLVVGHLLIKGVECYKAYTNYPDYDLVAVAPKKHKLIKIQVKSRWAINRAGNFPIESMDCDFVVHVALNRGIRKSRETLGSEFKEPEFYIFPIDIMRQYRTISGKINIRNIPNYKGYLNNWQQIVSLL